MKSYVTAKGLVMSEICINVIYQTQIEKKEQEIVLSAQKCKMSLSS